PQPSPRGGEQDGPLIFGGLGIYPQTRIPAPQRLAQASSFVQNRTIVLLFCHGHIHHFHHFAQDGPYASP
ncbi:MAG TPA: hypothetical protein PLL92_13620, partial [Alicycliphilus sp.]|nr:hypothetical protein [Alicycliphilus sp.]